MAKSNTRRSPGLNKMLVKTRLGRQALDILLNEAEWHTEFSGGEWHTLLCLTCNASFSNATEGSPDVKHKPNCNRESFFNTARHIGLLPKKGSRP